MNLAFWTLRAALLAVGLIGVAAAKEPDERVVEGAADFNRLWVRNSSDALISYSLKSGAKEVVERKGVIDLAADRGQILGLRNSGVGFEIFDVRSRRRMAPIITTKDDLFAIVSGPKLIVLGTRSLFRLEGGEWKSQTLDQELGWGLQVNPIAVPSGKVYVGFNKGEWGGGLHVIDPMTGRVEEVRRVDDNPCHGPLAHECDPVTGLIHDPENADCLLVSVGLAHMLSHGRIMRVCGKKVDVIYSRPVSKEHPDDEDFGSTWPFFALLPSKGGWVAVSYGRLFRSNHGVVTDEPLPELENWNGLWATLVGSDAVALSTDINWTKSLSGRTPLLVAIQR